MTNAKPKLLIVSPARVIGGGEVYLRNIVPELSRQFEVTILCPRQTVKFFSNIARTRKFSIFPKLLENKLPRHHRIKRLYYAVYFKIISSYLRSFDLVNVQWFDGALLESIGFRPLVVTMHTEFVIPEVYNNYVKHVLNKVDRVICVSQKTTSQIAKRGVDANKVVTIANGIQLGKYSFNKKPGNKIVWIGRVEQQDKNVMLFAEIAKESMQAGLGHKFSIVGEGSYVAKLKEFIINNKLDNLSLEGYCPPDRLSSVYKDSKILCLTSTNEGGTPYVVMEAMASGVPVIASDVGALPEIIKNNKNGLLVQDGSAKSYLENIDQLASDPKLYTKIAAGGRRTIQDSFNLERSALLTARLFNSLMGPRQ